MVKLSVRTDRQRSPPHFNATGRHGLPLVRSTNDNQARGDAMARASRKTDISATNPLGITCGRRPTAPDAWDGCSVETPCDACQAQIDAENDYLRQGGDTQ